MSEAAFPVEPARVRRPRLGYLMAAAAALLWGVNGAVSKTILSTGLSSERLAQVRSLGAAAGLVAIVAVIAPGRLRLTRRELPYLLAFGFIGLAFVQWFYFLAIHRLAIGVALLIEYLAPLLVALWARFVYKDPVRRRIWAALGLALFGLALIVNLFGGGPPRRQEWLFALVRRGDLRDLCPARRHVRRRPRCRLAARLGVPASRRSSGRCFAPGGLFSLAHAHRPWTSLHGTASIAPAGLGARGAG